MKETNNIWVVLLLHLLICSGQVAKGFPADGLAFVGHRNRSTDVGRGQKICPRTWREQRQSTSRLHRVACFGWLEDFFEPNKSASSASKTRQQQYPEQYPATYETNNEELEEDETIPEARLVRGLLKNTQLQSRPLQLVYDANEDGWDAASFHKAVDGRGASMVVATDENGRLCGGYNPKGYSSLGGARPSVAAFLFYERKRNRSNDSNTNKSDTVARFQKLRKVGGGGLACARDDPGFGISFGPDALIIGLQEGRERLVTSKLGPYFERGPEDLPSLFSSGATQLSELKVLVGCYDEGEDIPYSGGVLDMTSG